jgi:D-cysteine desulfhydrase
VEAAPFEELAELPTPVEPLEGASEPGGPGLWVKRDDLTSPVYGGNKVRTLEVLFAQARRSGCSDVVSTGAFGSNHAVATALHAPRVGLRAGAMLFPQPPSEAAAENLRVLVHRVDRLVALPHWAVLPFAMMRAARGDRRSGRRALLMVPGGATPAGALGYVSAAFELAAQIQRGELPRPGAIVVGVGSTCTSAGLLLGLSLAAARGIGSAGGREPPRLVSVRVTPWPVTSVHRIVDLAVRTSRLLAELSGDPSVVRERKELIGGLEVDGRQLGGGYGHPTSAGREAMQRFAAYGGPPLDTTYSAKSAAAALDRIRQSREPILYWATKSSASLPDASGPVPAHTPRRMARWLERWDAQRVKPSSSR